MSTGHNPMHNPDMLAFGYKLQKIIRDMKYQTLPDSPDEDSQAARRNAIVDALQDVCRRIEQDFGE